MPKDIIAAILDGFQRENSKKENVKDKAIPSKDIFADSWYILDGKEMNSKDASQYLLSQGFTMYETACYKVMLLKEAGLYRDPNRPRQTGE